MSIQIKKISVTSDKVSITYKSTHNGTTEECFLSSSEKGRESLYLAMSELNMHIVQLCELPNDVGSDLKATSISFSDNEGVMGAVITGTKKLSNSNTPLLLHTPHKTEFNKDGNTTVKHLPADTCRCLRKLQEAAIYYLKGKRAQGNLFDKEGTE